MFRVEFYVDDRKLGTALLALVGIAHGQPGVMPVSNIQKKGNGVAPISNGKTLERFAAQLKKRKATEITGIQAGEICKAIGLAESSKNYVLKQAQNAGMMKKVGKGSHVTYRVI